MDMMNKIPGARKGRACNRRISTSEIVGSERQRTVLSMCPVSCCCGVGYFLSSLVPDEGVALASVSASR